MSIFFFSFLVLISQFFGDDFVSVFAGIVHVICWSGRVLLSVSFNSLNCISGLVLLYFLIRRLHR